MIKLKKGTSCFFYSASLHFLLKCKVLRVEEDHRQDGKRVGHVVARITTKMKDRPAHMWQLMEVNTETPYGNIIPREAFVPGGINKPFEVIIDGDEE